MTSVARSRTGSLMRSPLGVRLLNVRPPIGDVIVGGVSAGWGGNPYAFQIAGWRAIDGAWSPMNFGLTGFRKMALHNGALYAATPFTDCVMVWNVDDTAWDPVGADPLTGDCYNLLSLDGALLACGKDLTTTAGGNLGPVAQFDGTTWTALGSWDMVNQSAAIVYGLLPFENFAGSLVAWGTEGASLGTVSVPWEGTVSGALMKIWNGTQWQPSPTGRPNSTTLSSHSTITDAAIHRGTMVMLHVTNVGGMGGNINGSAAFGPGDGTPCGALVGWDGVADESFIAYHSGDPDYVADVIQEHPMTRICSTGSRLFLGGNGNWTRLGASNPEPADEDKWGGIVEAVLGGGGSESRLVRFRNLRGGMRRTTGAQAAVSDMCAWGNSIIVASTTAEQAGLTPDTTADGLYTWNHEVWKPFPGIGAGGDVSRVFYLGSGVRLVPEE